MMIDANSANFNLQAINDINPIRIPIYLSTLKPKYQILPRLLFGLTGASITTGSLMIAISIFSLPVTTAVVTTVALFVLSNFVICCFPDKQKILLAAIAAQLPLTFYLTKVLGMSIFSIPNAKFSLLFACIYTPAMYLSSYLIGCITKAYLNCIGTKCFKNDIIVLTIM